MATKQTSLLSNRGSQTSAPTPNNVANERGRVRTISGSVALVAGDLDLNDIVMLAGVPTGAAVLSIKLASDDLDSNGSPSLAWDLGVYAEADDTAETKDEDAYATAITLGQAATAFTEYAFEARGIEKCGQKVYEDAGDSSDPNNEYFIGLSVSTAAATGAAGDLSFIIEYAID